MNSLGLTLAWTMLQVTLFCMVGMGLYLQSRRRGPAAAALTVACVLGVATVVSALAISPWPQWWNLTEISMAPVERKTNQLQTADETTKPATAFDFDGQTRDETHDHAGASESSAWLGRYPFFRSLLIGLQTEAYQSNATFSEVGWRWPAWLAVVVMACSGAGLSRLALSLIAVSRLRRCTKRVADCELDALLARIRGRLHCTRPIELRELDAGQAIGSPATIGWRYPVIILPCDWRTWSCLEREAVLAHEVAHVARGDFAIWLAAQLGVALHFYNPLVHWLSGRLRLEQEMAADLCGAAVAGGPQSYVTVLAEMALRQDQGRPLWAGRPFSPTRGTLMRRIEMLHNRRSFTMLSPSRFQRAIMLAALGICGLAVSGLRGPTNAARAETQAEVAAGVSPDRNEAPFPILDTSYLPAETVAVNSVKRLDVAGSSIMPVFVRFPGLLAFTMKPQGNEQAVEIEELRTIVIGPVGGVGGATDLPGVVIYRTSKPYDWSKLRVQLFGGPEGVTETTFHGQKCFRAKSEVSGKVVYYFLPDDRTIACLYEQDIERVMAADSTVHPAWNDEWQEATKSPIAIAGSFAALAEGALESSDKTQQMFASICKKAELVVGTVDSVAGGLEVQARAICKTPDDARQISTLTKLLLTLGVQQDPAFVKTLPLPQEYLALDLSGAVAGVLSGAVVNAEANDVRLKATISADFVSKFAQATAVLNTRYNNEQKQTHITKLGRLAEALGAYHAAHGHYPPSAVIGPDGKTPHSWRVELLPYLGEQKLYDRYKLDEPWDGEHNKQLVDEVPAAFHSGDWTQAGCSDYYLATGNGTVFDGIASPQRESISDNAGETILVIENRRQVPWTRPLDIDGAAQGNTWHPNGFHAAFADGTVKFLPADTDPATLRALFTKAGGEKVKLR